MGNKPSTGKTSSTGQISSAVGHGLLIFSGFVLAGALTVFVAISLRSGDFFRTLFHAGLLWLTVRLLLRNIERWEKGVSPHRPGERS